MQRPGVRPLAGGTDVFPAAGDRPLRGAYVDVTRLASLRGVTESDDDVRIGAATRWSEIKRLEVGAAFNALKAAAREVGSIQIQNRATIAGNLCNASPAADGVPPLLILDAAVELSSLRGVRRLPLSRFITGNRQTAIEPDELMTAIVVPRPSATSRSAFLKLGTRRYLVISIAMVAVLLDIADDRVADARIAVGACSAVAMRLPDAEQRLIGAPADEALSARVALDDIAALTPIDDLRATKAYRLKAALLLIRRGIDACVSGRSGGML